MQKPYTLIIPSWYPTREHTLDGIFIEKHVELISRFQNVVTIYASPSDHETDLEEKISDSYVKYTAIFTPSSSRLLNQLKYLLAQARAYNHIKSQYGRPSMLHLQVVFPAGIFVWLLLLFRRIPLIITEHWSGYTDEDGRYNRQMPLFKYITRQLFKKARKISVVSQYLKSSIIKLKLTDDKKICIVSNLLNEPASRPEKTSDPHPKALYIGNLNDHEKNISMLIAAVEIVVMKYPSFELTVIGGGGEFQKFKDLAEKKGVLNSHIHFMGSVPNAQLAAYYLSHSFFILTSNFETFNIAAAEALLYGLPVVSTRCGGPVEYINESTGIWIEEKNPEATAAAIMQMLERFDSFDMSAVAADMKKRYGRDMVAAELKNLYDI